MLHLKHKHHLDFSHVIEEMTPAHQMQLSPVLDDTDELTQAIANDRAVQDDQWELFERPNPKELDEFWTNVVSEVQNDPEWSFQDDD